MLSVWTSLKILPFGKELNKHYESIAWNTKSPTDILLF